jgi:hypothetical protein
MYDYFVLRINTIDHRDEHTNTEREEKRKENEKNILFFPKEYKLQRVLNKTHHIDSVRK